MSTSLRPGGVINGQQIFDGAGIIAADFGSRTFYLEDGVTPAMIIDIAGDGIPGGVLFAVPVEFDSILQSVAINGFQAQDGNNLISVAANDRYLYADNGSTVALDWSDPAVATFNVPIAGDGSQLTGVAATTAITAYTVTGTATNDNAAAGEVGEYNASSIVQGSAVSLVTATPKTVTSISLTAGDWDLTAIGAITGASTGTVFDVAIGGTTNSFTGTVLGDTRCQTPTVSLTGADASLMIPSVRVSIGATTTFYLIVQETFTIGSPKAYGRLSARRTR